MNLKDVIKRPIITEKATAATALGCYTFEVDKRANKKEIARAVKEFFGVEVIGVRTITLGQKMKKAMVQLKEGSKIDIFQTGD